VDYFVYWLYVALDLHHTAASSTFYHLPKAQVMLILWQFLKKLQYDASLACQALKAD